MPIRRELNGLSFDTAEESGGFVYADGNRHQCTETVTVEMGFGDILIHTASPELNAPSDRITFVHVKRPHPVGEFTEEFNGIDAWCPVQIIFRHVDSVDALIERLEKLKADMVK